MKVSGTTEASFKAAAQKIKRASENLRHAGIPNGLLMIGHEIMTDIKASRPGAGVPRKTGVLAGTGEVTKVDFGVELSFGGAAAPYALLQHEITTYRHKLGESRYLVRGIERWRPGGSAAMDAMKEQADAAIKAAAGSP